MKISGEMKFFIGTIVASLVILIGAIVYFSQPEAKVSGEVLVGTSPWIKGAEEPKVTLVEFSDFECDACKTAHSLLKDLLDKYPDDLQLIYRHFPLDQHDYSFIAAQAAEAAGEQGKFWDMHDALFENQDKLSEELIKELAQDLELDMDQFNQDIKSENYQNKIQQDYQDGLSLGINSTPTFFLNGQKMNLFSVTDLKGEVEAELAK